MPTYVHQNIGLFWNSAEMKRYVKRICYHVGLKSQTGMSSFRFSCEHTLNFLILTISDAIVFLSLKKLLLCYLFSFYFHAWNSPTQGMHHAISCITYSRIYRGNFFAGTICRGFFVFVSESFFACMSKSCLYGSKPFLYASKTFLFVKLSFLTVFLFVLVVPVIGHRYLMTYIKKELYEIMHIK